MPIWRNILAGIVLLFPTASFAEVIAASAGGFSLRIENLSKAAPRQAYEAFVAIGEWWDPSHSYSGDTANLSLELKPGGVFLETLNDGGFVKHLEVTYLNPGKEIRLLGGLGPLQPMAIHGAMTIQFLPAGDGSRIVMIYNVSGFSDTGLETLAPIVDQVQGGQMRRHADYANRLAAKQPR
jgi:hypothetical protein